MSDLQIGIGFFIVGFILTASTIVMIVKGHRDTK